MIRQEWNGCVGRTFWPRVTFRVTKRGMSDVVSNPTINHALRQARESVGISLREAADHVGITTASMSRLETGLASVTVERVDTLAKFYGLSLPDLLSGRFVTMPTTVDFTRLHAVVRLVQDVVHRRKLRPSPEKVADVTSTVFKREVEWLIDNPEADPAFDPERHREFVEMVFKR